MTSASSSTEFGRREFLSGALAAAACALVGTEAPSRAASETAPVSKVMTVTGEVSEDSLGVVLPHEHVMVDFVGADKSGKHRYDPDRVFEAVLPYLTQARKLGLDTLFECTPMYLGRDVTLLRRLSKASGLKIITNTGLYGAAGDKFVPAYAFRETAQQLADRWTREWEHGIEGTGIRPGFVKIGLDPEPSDLDLKLAEAAALTHLRTGLTIASHTTTGKAAKLQIKKLKSVGVSPSVFIWVHAHAELDAAMHIWAAKEGAWIEFDGLSPTTVDEHVRLVLNARQAGLLNHVLVSHDAGWFTVGSGMDGFRPYDTLFTQFIPALSKAGLSKAEIEQITRANPQRAFAIQRRERLVTP